MKTTTRVAIALLGMFTTFTATAQNNNVGIGTTTPDASSALEIESTTQGFLPPRMTQAQRNAIAAPVAAGLIVWCTNCGTDGELQVYNGTAWKPLNETGCGLAIGQTYQGGIIFYLDASGCHGLISAPTDQSTGAAWYNGAYVDTRAYGSGLFEGKYNTPMINWAQGGTSSAAAICASLSLGGYSDWYLPSIEELNKMYQNIGQGNALGLGNVGGFVNNSYWSSTEFNYDNAWEQYFYLGYKLDYGKFYGNYVRAVRAF